MRLQSVLRKDPLSTMFSHFGVSCEREAFSDLIYPGGMESSRTYPLKKVEKRAVGERHTDLRHLDVDSQVRREFLAYKWELLRISERRLDPRATFDEPAASFSSFGQVHADNRPTGYNTARYLQDNGRYRARDTDTRTPSS